MSLPRLSPELILEPEFQHREDLEVPQGPQFELPIRVLQFGSGRFLRAFCDFFIDRANRAGTFDGRVAIVQSTGAGRRSRLNEQGGLYTVCLRGLEKGKTVSRDRVLASVALELSAQDEWERVLEVGRSPDLQLIISNTTEVGIAFDAEDRPDLLPPRSFPGKLTILLWERFRSFNGGPHGLTIIPCELIEDNGRTLRFIVLELARRWRLGRAFEEWIDSSNRFCSSLVDRIVTGRPPHDELDDIQERHGFRDELLVLAEPYSLWAIEGDCKLRDRLGLSVANPSVLVEEDISPYRERKIRILNGTHTIMVSAALLLGLKTVRKSVTHPYFSRFVERVMREEIGPSLDVDPSTVEPFIEEVLDRFRNPFIEHLLIDIAFQSTSKMRLRVIPSFRRFVEKKGRMPRLMAFGFATFLFFLRGLERQGEELYFRIGEVRHAIRDERAGWFEACWKRHKGDDPNALKNLVREVASASELWGELLDSIPGFCSAVTEALGLILDAGIEKALLECLDP